MTTSDNMTSFKFFDGTITCWKFTSFCGTCAVPSSVISSAMYCSDFLTAQARAHPRVSPFYDLIARGEIPAILLANQTPTIHGPFKVTKPVVLDNFRAIIIRQTLYKRFTLRQTDHRRGHPTESDGPSVLIFLND